MGKNSRNSGAFRQDSIMAQFSRIANSKVKPATASDIAMQESEQRAEALARFQKQREEAPRFSSQAVSAEILRQQAENKPTDNQ
jgi:prephenate dehydrogenase